MHLATEKKLERKNQCISPQKKKSNARIIASRVRKIFLRQESLILASQQFYLYYNYMYAHGKNPGEKGKKIAPLPAELLTRLFSARL